MNEKREQTLLQEVDRLTLIFSLVVIIILVAGYFVIDSVDGLPVSIREFLLALIVNLIPVLLVFVISFWLFRRIQDIRSEREADAVAQRVGQYMSTAVSSSLAASKQEDGLERGSMLVRSDDNSERGLFLIDRFGLPRPIRDERTARYLIYILGYDLADIPKIPLAELKRTGPEVISFQDWRPPRTPEEEMSHEARAAFKFLGKNIFKRDGSYVLRFDIRNDGIDSLYVKSAVLSVDTASPLSEADVSPQNRPIIRGLLQCTLLFHGESESARLLPGGETFLALFLQPRVTEEAADTLIRKGIGYIVITGEFRDTPVDFMVFNA